MRAIFLSLALFCAGAFPLPLSASEKAGIKDLTAHLLERARKSRKDLGTMPRVDDGLPARFPGITGPEIIDALGSRLNSDEAIDAYMKFQLRIFPHDLGAATTQQVIRVIQAAPPYPSRPLPNARQHAIFKKASEVVVPKATIEPVIKDYQGTVGAAGAQHQPLHGYRRAISDSLGNRPDLQLLVEVRKAVDGYLANEWFAKETMEKATEQAQALRGSGRTTEALVKKTMLDLLTSLETANRQDAFRNRVHWVSLEGDGKAQIHSLSWLVDGDIFRNLRQAIQELPAQ